MRLYSEDCRRWLGKRLRQYRKIVLLPSEEAAQNLLICGMIEKKLASDSGEKRAQGLLPILLAISGGEEASPPEGTKAEKERYESPGSRYETELISGEAVREILALYCLYKFTDKLIIASLSQPCGRKIYHLVESGLLTEEELIWNIILRKL